MPQPNQVIERRFNVGDVEFRKADDGTRTMRGYAAVFGKQSENMGSEKRRFVETIQRGAFADVLGDDVRALFNHDSNQPLARSKGGKGTLKIWEDDTGLGYEFTVPDTQLGRDLATLMDSGVIDQSSFGFTIQDEEWREERNGDVITAYRTVKKVKRLYDVSPVTYPAYPDASVAIRNFEALNPAPVVNTFPLPSIRAIRLGLFPRP